MPLRDPIPPKGKAWPRGEHVSGIKLRYNQRVRIVAGAESGASGWVVAVDISGPEPIYTIEMETREPDQELRESILEPAP